MNLQRFMPYRQYRRYKDWLHYNGSFADFLGQYESEKARIISVDSICLTRSTRFVCFQVNWLISSV